jgi:hypothetical protein
MYSRKPEEPETVLALEGKVGFEWLLTTQISRIRDSKGDLYQKNVLDLKEMLYPYVQNREDDLKTISDDYIKPSEDRISEYEARIEEIKNPIIEKFRQLREPPAIRALEKETSINCYEWNSPINFYSDLRPWETEIAQIRYLRIKIEEEEEKETFLYYRAMYNFCMQTIYEIGLLPREKVKDEL